MTGQGSTTGANACPCCGGTLSEPFHQFGPVPVHSCLMLDDVETAAAFPKSCVSLAVCHACSFVTNRIFDPKWSAYDPSYEDQQSFSPVFSGFAHDLARETIERFGLHGKRAVEVGCSKGDYMRLLAELGGMDCVGVDPSVMPGRVPPPARGSMRFEQAYYGEEHLALPADLLTCRHTLEHIKDVSGTLRLFARHLAARPNGVLQIEVPDSTRLWADCAFEDIYYEHCSYFTPGSLARALREAGFGLLDLRREFGDQYLVAEASLDMSRDRCFAIEEPPAATVDAIEGFAARVVAKREAWSARIAEVRQQRGNFAIWGSGSKCVALMHALDLDATRVDHIVDINPHRRGKVAPGLRIPISGPEDLLPDEPVTVLVMNPIYTKEIAELCAARGVAAELIPLV